MKVKCIYNTGESLKPYEDKPLKKDEFGRFGTTEYTVFGQLEVGKEYLVMGIITFQTFIAYLIDDNGSIAACPCQLFEIIDNTVTASWQFRLVEKDEGIYPYVQGLLGYPELCTDKMSYENLIIEQNEDAVRIYFKRKMEIEKD